MEVSITFSILTPCYYLSLFSSIAVFPSLVAALQPLFFSGCEKYFLFRFLCDLFFSSHEYSFTPCSFVCLPWASASFSVLWFLAMWSSLPWEISIFCILGFSGCIVMASNHGMCLSLDPMLYVALISRQTLPFGGFGPCHGQKILLKSPD